MYLEKEEHDNGVVVLTVNRPDALNALNADVLSEIKEAALALQTRDDVRVVVITGAGRAFVAGADIAAMSTMSGEEALAFGKLGHDAMSAVEALPMPTIAAVNGFALGGGLELALSCDLIYLSEKAQVGLPEVGLGLIPGFGGTQRLARRVGQQIAREFVFTGGRIKAPEALAKGIGLAIFELEGFLDSVLEVAGKIAKQGPLAVRAGKRVMAQGAEQSMEDALATERSAFSSLFEGGESKIGMAAFLERRTPEF